MSLTDRLASLALVIADMNARLSKAEHDRDQAQQRVKELEAEKASEVRSPPTS